MQRRGILVIVLMMSCKSHGGSAGPPDAAAEGGGDTGAGACARVSFQDRPLALTTGPDFVSVMARDLDGDGVLDLVTANGTAGTISVLRGTGRGQFQPAIDYPAGGWPDQVVAADLDSDGILDLAVANQGTPSITILHGTGNGGFRNGQQIMLGAEPSALAISDLDGDGTPELAVLQADIDAVSVLRGNGDATFQAPVGYATGSGPASLAVADVDGDGHPDLLTANPWGDSLSIFLANGDGSFRGETEVAGVERPNSLTTIDLDGDGKVDIVTGGIDGGAVLFGAGDGTFRLGASYQTNWSSVAITDVTGDGRPDLIVADSTISVRVGNGDGTFQPAREYITSASTQIVAVLDMNMDGKLDLVTANARDGTVSILVGDGNGTFTANRTLRLAVHTAAAAVAVADVNRDGALDLIIPSSDLAQPQVRVFLGDGRAGFLPSIDEPTGVIPSSIAAADMNDDGNPDILLGGFGIGLLLGNGDGTFRPEVHYRYLGLEAFAVADMNGDGKLDLVVATASDLGVMIGHGDGTFKDVVRYPTGAQHLAVTDADGDGRLDVIAATSAHNSAISSTGAIHVLLGNGDGSLRPEVVTQALPLIAIATADLDRDGRADLVGAVENRARVIVLRGRGDATFGSEVHYATDGPPMSIAIMDTNGDDKLDIVTSNTRSGSRALLTLLLGNGDGTLQIATDNPADEAPEFMITADIDHDGRPDLIGIDRGGDAVHIMLGTCSPGPSMRE